MREYLWVLVGRLKVPYQDLCILSNSEIDALIYGHEIDIKERMAFERDMTGFMVSPYAKKGWDIRKEYEFSWDEPIEVFRATKEEIAEVKRISELVHKLKSAKNGESENRS